MKIVEIKVIPGIHTEQSPRGLRRKWKDGDKVRFRYSKPEKMKGWVDFAPPEASFLTSKPYPNALNDSMNAVSMSISKLDIDNVLFNEITSANLFVGGDLRQLLKSYNISNEITSSNEFISGDLRALLRDYSMENEEITSANVFVSGTIAVKLVSYQTENDEITSSNIFVGGTLS